MTLLAKDHYEMMAFFERSFKHLGRFDKEPKDLWSKGNIYQRGKVNQAFLIFRQGVAYGQAA